MSYNGHVVIDTDAHIREYWDFDKTYLDNLDPEYKDTYVQFSKAVKSHQPRPGAVGIGEVLWPRTPGHPMGVYDSFIDKRPAGDELMARREGAKGPNGSMTSRGIEIDNSCNWDPSVRLRDMDTAGVDKSVMFASQSDGYCMLDDIGFESALQRAYHRYMSNYCSDSNGRLLWIANSNLRDIPESIAQLRQWNDDPSFAGMFIPRALPDGSMLDHPSLHPLFEASQELDMPIWVHGGSNRPPFTPWVSAPNSVYHSLGGQFAMAGLIGGGVYDLFPKLRIGLFESFSGWVPYFLEKLDDSFRPGSAQTPLLKRKPSEIVAGGQFFCSIDADETQIEHVVAELGDDAWLFTTDYPHPGSPWPDGVSMVTERDGISEESKAKILGGNALRFLPKLAN